MNGIDTLAVQDAMVQDLVAADNYLGNHDGTVVESQSLFGALMDMIDEMLSRLFHAATGTRMEGVWLVVVIVALLALLVYAIIKRKTIMRWLHRDAPIEFEVRDDDIYGIDFDSRIAAAAGDHPLLVRLYYLKALRALVDAGRLDWIPGRTPSQYAMLAGMPPMTVLTNLFLKVRYGQFDADQSQSSLAARCCGEVCAALDVVQEGGEPS